MFPLLRDGDVVHVRPLGACAPRAGDVICYTRHDALFLHRVVGAEPGAYRVKGDTLDYIDTLASGEILGAVVAVRRGRGLRRLDTRVMRRIGRIAAALVPRALAPWRALRRAWSGGA
ncbi:MAG: S24/S26 family peptidase [Candidatus Rokubacteria bacterium]|nr:S24/S26 family peptidase [Candidatus Rokubacteria bacterium]